MRKMVALLTTVALLCATVTYAGGGSSGSSGSRSYSSGSSGSSGSRSYSSGSSGGSRSYSSGNSGGGSKSYSSGNSGKSYSSGTTPSGKSYSSGSDTPKATSPSGKSYTSGSSDTPKASSPSGKSYTSGGSPAAPAKDDSPKASSPSGKSYTSTSTAPSGDSRKPTSTNFNAGMSKAAKEQESKVAYQKATAPKPEFKAASGKTVKIDSGSKNVEHVRNITHETYITRETRVRTFYEPYYSRPVVHYSDPFGPFFYLWLFDKCSERDRAEWAYNHRSEMDDARWRDMCARDAQLEARVRQLEAEKHGVRDAAYIPAGIPADQKDLMYSDEFTTAAYNAQAVPVANHTQSAPATTGAVVGWSVFWVLVVLGILGAVVYLVFFKNWE